MDEIKTFHALAQAAESPAPDIPDVRDAVWKRIAAEPARDASQNFYATLAPWTCGITAAALLVIVAGCMTGYYYLLDDFRAGCLNAPYNEFLEQVFSVFWGGVL